MTRPFHGEDERSAHARWERLGTTIRALHNDIRSVPVGVPVDPAHIRAELARYAFQEPLPLADLTDHVAQLLRAYSLHVTHPRYFGLFNPGVREAGVAGEVLAAAFNPQLAVWSHSPIANAIEQHVLRHFSELLRLPTRTTAANFTAGGAEANLSALVVALSHRFPSFREEGVASIAGHPKIYISADAHDSFVKAARICGLGTRAICRLPAAAPDFTMNANEVRNQIIADRGRGALPFMIAATAGTTSTGAIDPLAELAAVAQDTGVWFHVDAAWGGAAAFSPALRGHIQGIELADSVTWDAHKWLSVPFSAGMFFCRHPQAVRDAFSVPASYMPSDTAGGVDPYATTMQWGRRAIGLKVFMSLAELGTEGYRLLIDHQANLGNRLRERLRETGFDLVNRTALPVICFTHPTIRQGRITTGQILDKIYSRGRVWISDVAPNAGERVLRACITHQDSNEADIECLIGELLEALENA